MPLKIKRSSSYTNQNVLFKKEGGGGFVRTKLFSNPSIPVVYSNPPSLLITQFSLISSSVRHQPVIYGGLDSNTFSGSPYGYVWDSTGWIQFNSPPGDSGLTRDFGVGGSNDGKFMLIGGFLSFPPSSLSYSSITWDPDTDTWSGSTNVPGFTNTVAYEFINPPIATNYRENRTYLWGGSDGSPPTIWRDQLVMWDGSSWTTVNNSTTVPSKSTVAGNHVLAMGAKDTGTGTELMLFTGSFDGVTVLRDQAIFYWTQNSTSPVSGTWSYVSGSTGDGEKNSMPQGIVHLMWENNRSRWTAMCADPNTSPNIWTSSNDGTTWNAYTYSVGAWSNPYVDLNSIPQQCLYIAPDPERNKFYITCISSAGSTGNQELWELNVTSSPGSSTLVKLYP